MYRIADGSIEIIKPAPGQLLPPEGRRRVGEGDGPEYDVLIGKLGGSEAVSTSEGQKLERELVGAQLRQPMAPPEYKVEAGRTGTVISYPEVPKERLELFKGLRERIREARARKADEAGIADEEAQGEVAAAPAARQRREAAPARPVVPPPARATGMIAERTTALSPREARKAARERAAFSAGLPDVDGDDLTRPTAEQESATTERAMREMGGGELRKRKPITFEMGSYVSPTGAARAESGEATVREAEAPAPTLAPARSKGEVTPREERKEAQQRMRAFKAAQRAARAGNGG